MDDISHAGDGGNPNEVVFVVVSRDDEVVIGAAKGVSSEIAPRKPPPARRAGLRDEASPMEPQSEATNSKVGNVVGGGSREASS